MVSLEPARAREEIDSLIATSDLKAAVCRLRELWRRESGPAAASFIVSRYEKLRDEWPMLRYRLAILRSFTVEPLVPLLRASCFDAGIDLEVHIGDFNAYTQEIIDPRSSLYEFEADAVVLAVQTRDIAPDLYEGLNGLGSDVRAAAESRVITRYRELVASFREHGSANLIIHNLEEPKPSLQDGAERGELQPAIVREINIELQHLASEHAGVYLLDYEALVAKHGRGRWHDERKWQLARLPMAATHLNDMVREWMRFIHPLSGKIAKALAVDLDNTLWGGVIGEDGLAGIRLSLEAGGAPYQALQRVLIDLHARGVLLCICSKNNPEDVFEALENPAMLVGPRHFSAMRIDWNDKSESLRALADELNIGIDSLAFLDDNPVERARVCAELPEVMVIELPDEPAGFAQALAESPVFSRLALTQEDQERPAYYAASRKREEKKRSALTAEDFFNDLQQEAMVATLTPAMYRRVAQLTQKTNQFNLTTRRYSEREIERLHSLPGWHVSTLRVRDRYGDNGLVGVAIVQACDYVWEIDTFLLSCRVIGRTVETALLAQLTADAREQGARELRGRFIPTRKNIPASDFYSRHGFTLLESDEEGSNWALDLSRQDILCPSWIRLSVVNGDKS